MCMLLHARNTLSWSARLTEMPAHDVTSTGDLNTWYYRLTGGPCAASNTLHFVRTPCNVMMGALEEAGERQGLTLVHFSAQRKRFVWDKGLHVGVV